MAGIKCKESRNGVLEPTFKENEMRCFLCGYVTEIDLNESKAFKK